MFEGTHAPPLYNDLYGFRDGAQNDIFVDSVLPAMNWEGAPKTGSLQAVPGVFASSGSAPAPPANADPSPSSPSPTPSSTPKAVTPNQSASSSSPKPTTKSGSGSTSSGSPPKKCKKSPGAEKMKKRSFVEHLMKHKRRSNRRSLKH